VACSRETPPGDAAVVQQLVTAGADVEKETRAAQTPLLAAVREGRFDAVKVLLAAGANPERESKDGGALVGKTSQRYRNMVT